MEHSHPYPQRQTNVVWEQSEVYIFTVYNSTPATLPPSSLLCAWHLGAQISTAYPLLVLGASQPQRSAAPDADDADGEQRDNAGTDGHLERRTTAADQQTDKSPTWYQGRAIFGLSQPGLVLLASSNTE